MTQMPPTLDVIVITWNNRDLALDCLAHLERSTVAHQLIVVDNASEDDTVEAVKREFPAARIVENERNIGYGPAINRGIAAGDGEFVALINNDANVEPDFLELAIAEFDEPKVGMVGGVSTNPADGSIDAAGILLDRGLGGYLHLTGEPIDRLDLDDPRLVAPAHVTVVYRRETLEQVGSFDEEIFAYCEEVDLVMRVRAAGWDFRVVPAARSVHIGSASLGVRTLRQLELAAWGRGYVAGRYRIPLRWLLTELAVGFVDMLRLRNPAPFSRRIAGWRRGRSLPRRFPPEGIAYVSWLDGMKTRWKAM